MKLSIYKLAEFKIIEVDTGELRWESHSGFGACQEGRCFKKGTILFIGPAENTGPGFLQLEFADHLKEFPDWRKTNHYCTSLDVYHCNTGRNVSKEEMRLWMFNQGLADRGKAIWDKPAQAALVDVAYRLHGYEIIIKKNGQIAWLSHAGHSIARSGACIVLEDILFIETSQNEQTNFSKQQFIKHLHQLPKWDLTKYYSPKLSLLNCKTVTQGWEEKKIRLSKEATETTYAGKGCNSITKFEISGSKPPRFFSELKSKVLQLFVKLAESHGEKTFYFWFNFKKPIFLKSISNFFRTTRIKKWLAFAAALILLTILLLLFFLFGHRIEHDEKRHHKKEEHSSKHREDH